MSRRPIGIFDSGVGGLTVFREIRRRFPHEDIVYFGDTARVPYGPKSRGTVIDYSVQNARFLRQQGAKIIVVACNTAASVALPTLERSFDVPVIGVIEPGALAAEKLTRRHRIGVIGTEGTIRSGAYQKAIQRLYPAAEVIAQPCPLFVPLAEEGWEEHPVARQIAAEYLAPLLEADIDTLVLGCTHYPILKQTLRQVVGDHIALVDSAEAVSTWLVDMLPHSESEGVGRDEFFVSDNEEKFRRLASRILDSEVDRLQQVSLGETWYVEHPITPEERA
ncbi:MAG: glutamate racemase [Candidatus Cloacimonetes bacterium]|nr:glutamate racemase [Candidatus Cloacimonadota bacterium]